MNTAYEHIDDNLKSILKQQIEYYKARSSEYDEWFFRQGRYDRGPELNAQWFREVENVRSALNEFNPQGSILELACGTGLWTEQLIKYSENITAIDASKEVLNLNFKRVGNPKVKYIEADIFNWNPTEKYDVVFFSFWLSHVPENLLESFWRLVRLALKPTGRFYFIDSKYEITSTANNHTLGNVNDCFIKRRLNDNSEYKIVKIFHQKSSLISQLIKIGFDVKIEETSKYFIYGFGKNLV